MCQAKASLLRFQALHPLIYAETHTKKILYFKTPESFFEWAHKRFRCPALAILAVQSSHEFAVPMSACLHF